MVNEAQPIADGLIAHCHVGFAKLRTSVFTPRPSFPLNIITDTASNKCSSGQTDTSRLAINYSPLPP